jgi:CBS-domain-containing membrane protein
MSTTQTLPCVQDIMDANLHAIASEASLAEVIAHLAKHRIVSAPVVEPQPGGPTLLGCVSEEDCLRHLANELFYGCPCPPQTAGLIMQRHPVCLDPQLPLFAAASIFTSHRLSAAPVVDEQRRLLGIVRRSDVLLALDRFARAVETAHEQAHTPFDVHDLLNMRLLVQGP